MIIEFILLKQWGEQMCIQDILQSNTMVCCIFFAQKCRHVFYIFELKGSPAHIKTGSETSLIFGTSSRIRIGIYICEELDLELDTRFHLCVELKMRLKKKKKKRKKKTRTSANQRSTGSKLLQSRLPRYLFHDLVLFLSYFCNKILWTRIKSDSFRNQNQNWNNLFLEKSHSNSWFHLNMKLELKPKSF